MDLNVPHVREALTELSLLEQKLLRSAERFETLRQPTLAFQIRKDALQYHHMYTVVRMELEQQAWQQAGQQEFDPADPHGLEADLPYNLEIGLADDDDDEPEDEH